MRDKCIQNPAKVLRWNALENQLQFSIISVKNSILNLWGGSEYVSGFKYIRVLKIWRFSYDRILNVSDAWICNYGWVLNIPGFQVCPVPAYASIAQGSEYAWIWLNNALWKSSENAWSTFHRVLHMPPFLNVSGLRIWQSFEYASVTQGAKYAWISLNMP